MRQVSYSQGYARNKWECAPEWAWFWDGLVGLWVPALGPTGNTLWDLGPGRYHATNYGASWTVAPAGSAVDFDSTDYFEAIAGDAPFLGPITIMWTGVVDTSSAYRHFVGKHAWEGGTANPFDFRTDNGSPLKLEFVRANTGYREWITTETIETGVWQSYTVTAPTLIETPPAFYINGKLLGTNLGGGSGSGALTGSGASIRVGRRSDGVVQMDGKCGALSIHSLILSQQQVHMLSMDPLGPLRLPRRRLWPVVEVAPGGANLPAISDYYRRFRRAA